MDGMEISADDPRNFHSCDLCSYGSKSLFVIVNHIRKHHGGRKINLFDCESYSGELYECEHCGFETELMVNLNDHVNVVHKDTEIKYDMRQILMSYICQKCNFHTHSLLMLLKHGYGCMKNTVYSRQDYKTATLKQKPLEKITLNTVNSGEWYTCDQCSYRIKHKGNLRRHILAKHSAPEDIKWYKCQLCLYKAKRRSHLDKHVLSKHTNPEDVEWLECAHCGLKTKHKNTLKSHILAKHSNEEDIRQFECVHCPFKTLYKFNLQEHILRRHSPSSKKNMRFKRERC